MERIQYLEKLAQVELQRSVPLFVVHTEAEIVAQTGLSLFENCAAIAHWIDADAQRTQMLHKEPEELASMVLDNRATVVLEPDSTTGKHKIIGFCALTMTHPEGEKPLAWELGAMIKGDTDQTHVGLLLLVETLRLPRALELEAVVAYCNPASYHIFVEKAGGIDASEETITKYNLVPWKDDKRVDLTPMRDQIHFGTRRITYES